MDVVFDLGGPDTFTSNFAVGDAVMVLTLKRPTTAERMSLVARNRVGTDKANFDKYIQDIARFFWVSFEGAADANGKQIENTEANRIAMLQASQPLLNAITSALYDVGEREEEGNAGSV